MAHKPRKADHSQLIEADAALRALPLGGLSNPLEQIPRLFFEFRFDAKARVEHFLR